MGAEGRVGYPRKVDCRVIFSIIISPGDAGVPCGRRSGRGSVQKPPAGVGGSRGPGRGFGGCSAITGLKAAFGLSFAERSQSIFACYWIFTKANI